MFKLFGGQSESKKKSEKKKSSIGFKPIAGFGKFGRSNKSK